MFLSPQNRAKQAELKFTGNAYQPLSPSLPSLPALLIPHCLTVADCNPCGASQIHIGVIKSGSSGRELTQEIMIIVTIVRTVSIAKNSPYRIERYRECYIVFANTISPLWLCRTDSNPSIAASTSIANIETIFIKSSYIKSAPICIGCASSCLRDRKNIVNNVKSYRESNCISTSSPL